MYSYLFFGLTILGLFSIIENIKGIQKISLIKFYFLIFLFSITFNSAIDFCYEFGYDFKMYGAIFRLFTTISAVNLFYLFAHGTIPKLVIYIEVFLFIIYLIAILYGFRFIELHNGHYLKGLILFNRINLIVTNPLIMGSIGFNLIKIRTNTDYKNLYQIRIKNWISFLNLFLLVAITSILVTIILYSGKGFGSIIDSRLILFCYRFLMTVFILFRPKFIDEFGFDSKLENLFIKSSSITNSSFEFAFYSNYYFLNREANLEDLALKLNHTKAELVEYLKTRTDESFNDFLNRSRIDYLKELLINKKSEYFTIEALSEMSGFNNRRTMYNYFKKYVGITPTEFINKVGK